MSAVDKLFELLNMSVGKTKPKEKKSYFTFHSPRVDMTANGTIITQRVTPVGNKKLYGKKGQCLVK